MAETRVADLMTTALMTARLGDVVEDADFDMKLAGVRHLPVVDDKNHLVGIVSDRDVLRAFTKSPGEPVRIRNVMTAAPVTVTEDTPAADAAMELIERKIGCLPVVGDEGQLVGVVTETDFVRVAYEALAFPEGIPEGA